jgi:hypothetical protein
MTRTLRVACLAVLASGTASANVVASGGDDNGISAGDDKPAPRRIEGRVGMLLGGSDVGDADGFSIGLTTGLGYRIGDVTFRARFDHYRVGDSSDEMLVRRGRGTRIGGAVRYSFASTAEDHADKGVGVDFWGEAGIGLEHVAWRDGGVLDRPSGELAIGFELDGYGARNAKMRRRHIGYFMGFRSLFGEGPEMDGLAVCGGPCTKATKPSRLDISMFFEVGMHWGR